MRLILALVLATWLGVLSYAQDQSLGDVARQFNKKKLAYQTDIDVVAETDDLSMGPYLGEVMTRIREKWLEQVPMRPTASDCRLEVQFAVLRDGKADAARVVESCKNEPLESAALAGITRAAPFAAIPAGFRQPQLWLRVTFTHHAAGKEQRGPRSAFGTGPAAQ